MIRYLKTAVNDAIASGNAFLANEITANVMVGTTMMIIVAVMMLCLILNEVGVFTADKSRKALSGRKLIEPAVLVPLCQSKKRERRLPLSFFGGRKRTRTADLLRVKQAL